MHRLQCRWIAAFVVYRQTLRFDGQTQCLKSRWCSVKKLTPCALPVPWLVSISVFSCSSSHSLACSCSVSNLSLSLFSFFWGSEGGDCEVKRKRSGGSLSPPMQNIFPLGYIPLVKQTVFLLRFWVEELITNWLHTALRWIGKRTSLLSSICRSSFSI